MCCGVLLCLSKMNQIRYLITVNLQHKYIINHVSVEALITVRMILAGKYTLGKEKQTITRYITRN